MSAIPSELQEKERALLERLRAAGRVLVAFSGGVDSSYLALAAHRSLGDGALAVTAVSPSYPESHRSVAESGCTCTSMPPLCASGARARSCGMARR